MRWIKRGLVGLVVLVFVLLGGLYGFTSLKLSKDYSDVAGHALILPAEADEIAEGRRLLEVYHCTGCHGEDLGGTELIDEPLMARLWSANLTSGRGGIAGRYDPADWERAIRHGVSSEGRPLIAMPSADYGGLSNADLGRMVAWLEQAPPVDREAPSTRLGPGARAFLAAGVFSLSPDFEHHAGTLVEDPDRDTPLEFGRYLARSCAGCHGETFAGGEVIEPGAPPSANLTPHAEDGLGSWSLDDFDRAMREGVRPDGRELASLMPWQLFASFEPSEIEALWAYLGTLEPLPDPVTDD
jgi:cytochrome c553